MYDRYMMSGERREGTEKGGRGKRVSVGKVRIEGRKVVITG